MMGIPYKNMITSYMIFKIKKKFTKTDLYPYGASRYKNFQVLASPATKKVKNSCLLHNFIRTRAGDQTLYSSAKPVAGKKSQ